MQAGISRLDRFRVWALRPKTLFCVFCFVVVGVPAIATYQRLARAVDARLRFGPLGKSISVYAAPHTLTIGEALDAGQVAAELRQAGYSDSNANPAGHYRIGADLIEIYPGAESFFRAEPARVDFHERHIHRIVILHRNEETDRYSLEPQLMFDVSGQQRQRRRFVHFAETPNVLVSAVLSAEDKHFFHHPGLDLVRVVKAAYVNMKSGRRGQGGSTLTMQLARSLWLDSRKSWTRKVMEGLITLILEQRLSKQEIFEYYANEIYLGEHETFSVHGFGEAARIYFNKDLSQISLSEAALLAGIIQRPVFFDPVRHPERAITRRNVVLALMRQNGYITEAVEKDAAASPSGISPVTPEQGDAPFFLTLAMDELRTRMENKEPVLSSCRVYTTFDPKLQRAAVEAVNTGVKNIDSLLRKKNGVGAGRTVPQVALVALDAHTGEVKAVVGGRNYGASQLNHAVAWRQPGSVFKPFVYAAALSGETDGKYLFTPASIVDDAPATFNFGTSVYEPHNFGDRFYGPVTLRKALSKSMNLATVSLAEEVGYKHVVELARRAGLNDRLRATPALALGAYEVTPLEISGAYTVFANEGTYVRPTFVSEVRSGAGDLLFRNEAQQRPVLDPRVAFLMRSLLEEVVQSGTAAGVRARGLRARVAGKTGTSHDGWFAGFTANLICVVWVGFDDNSELELEGAKSALPIWTEFMKRAVQNPYYGAPFDERIPDGIVAERIDPESGELAGALCPESRPEFFIAGSEPKSTCPLHGGSNSASADRVEHSPSIPAHAGGR